VSAAAALLALLLAAAAPAAAQEEGMPSSAPQGTAVEDESAAVEDMRGQLEGDPGLREALVDRILRSRLAGAISKEHDASKKREDIRQWVEADPRSAAEVALGLSRDDAKGSRDFELSVSKRLEVVYRRNNTGRGAYGVLKSAARDSKRINKAMEEASGEEQRELLKNLFEGKGGMSGQVITGEAPEGKPADEPGAAPAAAAGLAGGWYDRLSAGNLRGYSPQLLAMQSALNQRRPPNAPKLVETGKLDHATLAYPAFGLRWDAGNLEERLRRERVLALAALSRATLTARDWKDPGLEARLAAKADAARLPPRLAARAASLARAAAAIADFESAAAAAKDPSKITRRLLVELSHKQREAARWITIAALEEDLSRVDADEGFLTPELLAAVDAVPAPADMKAAYKKRAESLRDAHARVKSNAEAALAALKGDAWASSLAEVERLMAANRGLKSGLSRDIAVCRRAPFGVTEALKVQPRWRVMLEDLAMKWAPSLAFSREASSRRGRLARWVKVFAVFASGDMNAAHAAFASAESVR
jgi:hypothetical protein